MLFFKRFGLILLALALAPTFAFAQDLNSVNNQIQQNQNQLNQAQAQSQTLQGQVNAFDQSIGDIQNQINTTQANINTTQTNIVALSAQIAVKQQQMADEKKTLNESLVFLYETGNTPILGLIMSGQSISSSLDQMEYISMVEKKVEDTINQIEQAKKVIEADQQQQENEKASLVQLEQQQTAKMSALSDQRSAKASLLAYTQNNEQIYQQKLGSLEQQREYLIQQQNIQIVYSGNNGGYPYWNYSMDSSTDFGPARECTSYAAWKRASVGKTLTFSWRDAWEWASEASAAGYSVDQNPQAGDVMVIPRDVPMVTGGYGHVTYVGSVNSDGSVNVSQYNFYTEACTTPGVSQCMGNFSEMTISKNAYLGWNVSFIH
jgi:surface antigen